MTIRINKSKISRIWAHVGLALVFIGYGMFIVALNQINPLWFRFLLILSVATMFSRALRMSLDDLAEARKDVEIEKFMDAHKEEARHE